MKRKTLLTALIFVTGATGAALAGLSQLSPSYYAYVTGQISAVTPNVTRITSEQRRSDPWMLAVIEAARSQIGVTTRYDGGYASISYPNGDIPRETGVCTDVVIRALRDAHAIDLQKRVHEDMRGAFSSYPQNWGLSRPDRNIDHRRVPNLRRYFERRGQKVAVTDMAKDYLPGDVVTWTLGPGQPHIGIVSDRVDILTGEPLILHNVGAGTREQRFLFAYPITGHYRLSPS